MNETYRFLRVLDDIHAKNISTERKKYISVEPESAIVEELTLVAMNRAGTTVVYPFLWNDIIAIYSVRYDENADTFQKQARTIPISYRLCEEDEDDLISFARLESLYIKRTYLNSFYCEISKAGIVPPRFGAGEIGKIVEYLYFTTHENALKSLWEDGLDVLAQNIMEIMPDIIDYSGNSPEEVIKICPTLLKALNNKDLFFYLKDPASYKTIMRMYKDYISNEYTSPNIAQIRYLEMLASTGLEFSHHLYKMLSSVHAYEDKVIGAYYKYYRLKRTLGYLYFNEVPEPTEIETVSSLMQSLMVLYPKEEQKINRHLVRGQEMYGSELLANLNDRYKISFPNTVQKLCQERIDLHDFNTLERDIEDLLSGACSFFTVYENDRLVPAFSVRIDYKSSLISAIYSKHGLSKEEYLYLRDLIVSNSKLGFDGDTCVMDDYDIYEEEDTIEKVEEEHPSFEVVISSEKLEKDFRALVEGKDFSIVYHDFIKCPSYRSPVFILVDKSEIGKDEVLFRRIYNYLEKYQKALIIGVFIGDENCKLPILHSIEVKKEDMNILFPVMSLISQAFSDGYERVLRRMISMHSKISYLKGDISHCAEMIDDSDYAHMYKHTAYSLFAIFRMGKAEAFKAYKRIKSLEKDYDDTERDLVICNPINNEEELLIIHS